MAGEMKIEKAEPFATMLTSDYDKGVGGPQLVSWKEGLPYEHGVHYPPTSSYTQLDEHHRCVNGASNSHMSDNGSVVYYLPGYSPSYAPGTFSAFDSQGVPQQQSEGLIRGPRSYNKSPHSDSAVEEDVSGSVNLDENSLSRYLTEDARFYVIKSDCEDDVHKSIKYDAWTSTPAGNEDLNIAFRDAKARSTETGKKCPIFLFFSVSGSRQFVGFAEMTGEVNFDENMDFWQDDKWSGFFPVLWHVIKDIPDDQFLHISRENNSNEPVMTALDTEEIGLNQGFEMIKTIIRYAAKTSLLDDFSFYEVRENSLRIKRGKTTSKFATCDDERFMKPPRTDSVQILVEDVLNNVQQVNSEVAKELKPVLSKNGIVCELKADKFELSIAPGTKAVPKIIYQRAMQAISAVTVGVKADLALYILLGEMDMTINCMEDYHVEEEVWDCRQNEFIFHYDVLRRDRQVPFALIEHFEQSILVVATPPVLLLLGDFINDYIKGRGHFDLLADAYLKSYEKYKCYPHRLQPFLIPPYKFAARRGHFMGRIKF